VRDEIDATAPCLASGGAHRGGLRAVTRHHPPAPRHPPAVKIAIRGYVNVVMSGHDVTSTIAVDPLAGGDAVAAVAAGATGAAGTGGAAAAAGTGGAAAAAGTPAPSRGLRGNATRRSRFHTAIVTGSFS